MQIAKQFVAAKMEAFVMRIQRLARVLQVGLEKFALIAANQVIMELIALLFVNASMEQVVTTSLVNAFVNQVRKN